MLFRSPLAEVMVDILLELPRGLDALVCRGPTSVADRLRRAAGRRYGLMGTLLACNRGLGRYEARRRAGGGGRAACLFGGEGALAEGFGLQPVLFLEKVNSKVKGEIRTEVHDSLCASSPLELVERPADASQALWEVWFLGP